MPFKGKFVSARPAIIAQKNFNFFVGFKYFSSWDPVVGFCEHGIFFDKLSDNQLFK
jgi:hypothetical protein